MTSARRVSHTHSRTLVATCASDVVCSSSVSISLGSSLLLLLLLLLLLFLQPVTRCAAAAAWHSFFLLPLFSFFCTFLNCVWTATCSPPGTQYQQQEQSAFSVVLVDLYPAPTTVPYLLDARWNSEHQHRTVHYLHLHLQSRWVRAVAAARCSLLAV